MGNGNGPGELFDLLDEDGRPTGEVCPRALVHARGLWHRAFHLFVVGIARGAAFGLLQKRAANKDVNPQKLDVSVGGHFRAGESLEDVVRETEEEIGLIVVPDDLTYLWTQTAVHEAPGVCDREWQDVYLIRRDWPVARYRPDPGELAALVAMPLADLEMLLAGRSSGASGEGLFWDGGSWQAGQRTFARADFIDDREGNLLRLVRAAGRWLGRPVES